MNGLYGEVIDAKKDISRVETNSTQSKEATEERGCEEITSKPNKIFDNFFVTQFGDYFNYHRGISNPTKSVIPISNFTNCFR